MKRQFQVREIFAIVNPNKAWVVKELDKLRKEWSDWLDFANTLGDSPDFDPNTCAEAVKDGFDNLRKHEVLREKTLVFIGNNFTGYGFVFDNWPSPPHEDNLSRISRRIPCWIAQLETLNSCIDYARVPESYWKTKGKQLVDEIIKATPDKAIDIAASYLKNPT
ncbi:MAG: hypothetical protein ACLPIX_15630 [Rhodomicrobium sp.]